MRDMNNTPADAAKALNKFKTLVYQSRTCMFCAVTAGGEMITKPLYTAGVDESGDLYFYFREDVPGFEHINWNNNISLIYSNTARRTHLEVTGKSVMIMDKQRTRDFWSPLLQAYFPKGRHTMKLMKVHVTQAAYYCDFHAAREILIQVQPVMEAPHTDIAKKAILQKVV